MQFSLYEAGDMVQTPDGKAMVIEDQRVGSNEIRVQLEGTDGTRTYHMESVRMMRSA